VTIDAALLGCGHPHVPDVLGVVASEPDLRLAGRPHWPRGTTDEFRRSPGS
jgi:hypothetical protein